MEEEGRTRDPNAAAWAFLRLLRPADWGVACAGAALGARLAGAPIQVTVVPAAAAVAAVISGAFINGDWLHRRTRLLAKPSNPLARGLVKPVEAKWLGTGLLIVGLAVAAYFGLRAFAAAFFTAAFALLINYFFDKTYFARNVLAAGVVALPVFYGWLWADAAAEPPVVAAVAGGVMALAASVFRDVEDREADEVVGRRTVATAGGRLPVVIAGGAVAVAVAISMTPYFLDEYTRRYLALVAAVGALLIFYTILNLRHAEPDPLFAGSTARMIKFLVFVFFAGVYWETLG